MLQILYYLAVHHVTISIAVEKFDKGLRNPQLNTFSRLTRVPPGFSSCLFEYITRHDVLLAYRIPRNRHPRRTDYEGRGNEYVPFLQEGPINTKMDNLLEKEQKQAAKWLMLSWFV